MKPELVISIMAICISFIGCILVPFITKWVNDSWEKERLNNEFLFNLNSLKEKWLSYFRNAIEDYIEICTTICILKDSVTDHDSDDFCFHIAPYHARVESKASKLLLLFKKDAPELNELIPILTEMMEATKEGNLENVREIKMRLIDISRTILHTRWNNIQRQMQIDALQ